MKVAELKKGMLIQPRGRNKFTLRLEGMVLGATPHQHHNVQEARVAMYLGKRDDIGIKLNDGYIDWSNRYVLYKDMILAVDPSDWNRIEPIK